MFSTFYTTLSAQLTYFYIGGCEENRRNLQRHETAFLHVCPCGSWRPSCFTAPQYFCRYFRSVVYDIMAIGLERHKLATSAIVIRPVKRTVAEAFLLSIFILFSLMGQFHDIFDCWFFHQMASSVPITGTLQQFGFFPNIRRDI